MSEKNNLILLAEERVKFREIIAHQLIDMGYEVKVIESDGAKLKEKILSDQPIAVLAPTFIRGMDMFDLLETPYDDRPLFFVAGRGESLRTLELLGQYGMSGYLDSSISAVIAAAQINDEIEKWKYTQQANQMDMEYIEKEWSFLSETRKAQHNKQIASKMLQELGIPTSVKGYAYWVAGMVLLLEDRKYLESITKELYPMIAKQCDSTASRVERAMRKAVEIAWLKDNEGVQKRMFGYCLGGAKGKPSNSELLVCLLEVLERQRQ